MAKIKKTGRHTSAIKSHRQSLRRRARNFRSREEIRNLRKEMLKAVQSKDKNKARAILLKAYSVVDKAAKTGVIHKNNAARKKSFLARQFNLLAAANIG